MDDDLFAIIDGRLNWERPELRELKARKDAGAPRRAIALDLIGHLRKRTTPKLGYSPEYVREVRAHASAEAVLFAREQWEEMFVDELIPSVHNCIFYLLGAERIMAAATPDLCKRTAASVLAYQPHWDRARGAFGPTLSLCHLLSYLFPLDECENEDLLPILCWLLVQTEKEWERAREWDDQHLGNSGHNWWIHAFYGLWLSSLFFPEFKCFNKFEHFYPAFVERELKLLFYKDGWSKEGAAGYHYISAMLCHKVLLYAELNDLPVSSFFCDRVRDVTTCIHQLAGPGGMFPVFHDDEGPRVTPDDEAADPLPPGPYSITGYLRVLAAKYEMPEAKHILDGLAPDWRPGWPGLLPFLGKNYHSRYQQLSAKPPASVDSVVPDGGYYVMRSGFCPDADYLAINAGLVGPLVTSHKHVDIFNFVLFAKGRPILVDNWYGDVPEMADDPMVRRWRVGSSAHNVSTVDGQDQVEVQQVYRYAGQIVPTIDDWHSEEKFAYFSGAHEGYQRLPEPVPGVRRKIFYLRDRYWILIDRFTPSGAALHNYQLHFHLNAPAELGAEGRVSTSGEGGNLLLVPVGEHGQNARLAPSPYPIQGYQNPNYLTYEAVDQGQTVMVTLLVPFQQADVPAVTVESLPVLCDGRTLSENDVTALRITVDGEVDRYVDFHKPWTFAWSVDGQGGVGRLWHSAVSFGDSNSG